ncbi:MAG TPA: hypothetical protein VFA68_09595 [Terriglobales bacterium]|nr:hypothetical protein [Terriglobales bacterium]
MAKRIYARPDWLNAPHVADIYSVSGCISEYFADYIQYWKHNGHWFFDSAEIIKSVAEEHSISLERTSLFYYEAYELEFNGKTWQAFGSEQLFTTKVTSPSEEKLEGFDVVTFYVKTAPECSPLSCNSIAEKLPTNEHCLLASFEVARNALDTGAFNEAEPGPYRIFAVYSVPWC